MTDDIRGDGSPRHGVARLRETRDARLLIIERREMPWHASVIGSLTSETIEVLLDSIAGGTRVLDLSQVDQADDAAVRALAALPPERCVLASCPRWLELWLARTSRTTGSRRE